jgi:hypothetical protein
LTLRYYSLRFTLLARDPIYFPPFKSANILRGGFGTMLRETVPAARFARLFAPTSTAGPSGFADPPRPFVFRAAHLDGRRIAPGERFEFAVNLFDTDASAVNDVAAAIGELASRGIGPAHGRADLENTPPPHIGEIPLDPLPDPVSHARVQFITPTELKGADQPDFGTLLARIRDRVSKLRELYGEGPLALDFRAFGERAAQVRMTRCDIRQIDVERRSSRTGEIHPIGGFVGDAEYQGELAEFLPFLRAAEATGVGRQTVWGKGQIAIT